MQILKMTASGGFGHLMQQSRAMHMNTYSRPNAFECMMNVFVPWLKSAQVCIGLLLGCCFFVGIRRVCVFRMGAI